MGYCDGVMDPSMMVRYKKMWKEQLIFTFGRAYPMGNGSQYYGVKWELPAMKKYDSQTIYFEDKGYYEIFDDDEIEIVAKGCLTAMGKS